jgi:predicted enzyme related to lactoylglutathione lyase
MEGASEGFAAIGLQDPPNLRPHWMFIKVPEGKSAKNRFHPDLIAADLEAEVKRLIGVGAVRKRAFDENGARWVTMLDPEGNEFDVVAEST